MAAEDNLVKESLDTAARSTGKRQSKTMRWCSQNPKLSLMVAREAGYMFVEKNCRRKGRQEYESTTIRG
jgi:hypothetical protein